MNKLLFALLFAPSMAGAVWQGKIDLSPEVYPVAIRELHDGNWLAGYAKPNLFHVDQDGKQRFHVGIFHAWRSDKGDPSIGLMAGVDIGDAGLKLGTILSDLGLPDTIKWLGLANVSVTVDTYGGYRPVHGDDVHSWIYGLGACLQKKFGPPDLAKGL